MQRNSVISDFKKNTFNGIQTFNSRKTLSMEFKQNYCNNLQHQPTSNQTNTRWSIPTSTEYLRLVNSNINISLVNSNIDISWTIILRILWSIPTSISHRQLFRKYFLHQPTSEYLRLVNSNNNISLVNSNINISRTIILRIFSASATIKYLRLINSNINISWDN